MSVAEQSASTVADTGGASPWDSQPEEYDYTVDDIEGAVPDGLRGVLYRIGPGRFHVGGHPIGHIFDGDGMVSRIEFTDDSVTFRNRYVRTRSYLKANDTGCPPRGFGTQRAGGALANALRFPANMANTNVLVHAEKLYSLWEGGRPHRLDAATLATDGPESFGGALKRLGAFSAHPKTDPSTGDVFNFGLDFFPRPMIRCYRLDARRTLHSVATFPLPHLGFIHDFALTTDHMVFVLGPLVVHRPIPVALGLRPFDDALTYRPELGTRIVLVPRDGRPPVTLEYDALFHFHVTNAYERPADRETVVEIVKHDPSRGWPAWNRHLHDYRDNAGPAFGGTLTRLRINTRTGRITEEPLNDRGCEFPQLDPRHATRGHAVTYLAEASRPGGDPDSIATVDHRSGRINRYVAAEGDTICEPLFAPDPESVDEGRGWLLSIEHQSHRARSRVIVLRADDPAAGPVAVANLRHHVPMTFHGAFASR
ncbi:carotenoid oxygenase family protein [Gordonia sp. ABSL1-1]|uniref:carotenoid oxygenase family protein n=1 Tax=Gordonia sp. ABSL1-1 TaxID=3053923 RepID=UPI0025726AC1|nr:carotenoid oxygenase family protein [Gordonia sp. ABSL1-1]MDL9935206.1 carotenoid oxygenase family protein [Gordonia sp. ABSL1-1]